MNKKPIYFTIIFTIILVSFQISSARDIIRIKTNPTGGPDPDQMLEALKQAVQNVNNSAVGRLGTLSDLSKGFADANTMATSAGNLNSFQNYESFAIFTGFTFSMQMPSLWDEISDIIFLGEGTSLKDDVIENGDPYFGVGAGVSWINLGFNINDYFENLYINVKFGKTDFGYNDFGYSSTLLGLEFNYSYEPAKSLLWGNFIKWRGISLGSGLLYYNSNVSYSLDNYASQTGSSGLSQVTLEPNLDMEIDISTYTIPMNVCTSIRVLHVLNLSAGIGCDVNFGKSKINLSSNSPITATHNGTLLTAEQSGEVEAISDTDPSGPSILRLKSFYGLGLNFGPAKLEIQYGFYYGSGFSWTINMGTVF